MHQKAISYKHIHRLLIPVLFFMLVILACLYVYFLSKSVLNVVMREEIESRIAEDSSTIGELEAQYLSLKNAVDLKEAEALGLTTLSSKQYAQRHSLKDRALTLND